MVSKMDLREAATIKETTERILDIRTGLLAIRGQQELQRSIALDQCKASLDGMTIQAEQAKEGQENCEENYRKLDTKRKVGNAFQYTLIGVLTIVAAVLAVAQ